MSWRFRSFSGEFERPNRDPCRQHDAHGGVAVLRLATCRKHSVRAGSEPFKNTGCTVVLGPLFTPTFSFLPSLLQLNFHYGLRRT